jgi:putative protease
MTESKVGIVTNYYRKISVAAVQITDGSIEIGDNLLFSCYCDDVETCVNSMEMYHKPVQIAKKGDSVGILVPHRVHKGDEVYKIMPEAVH